VYNVPARNCCTIGVQDAPKSSIMINLSERGNTASPPCAIHGKLTARQAHGRAGVRCWKKQMPSCNVMDRI